MPPCHAPFAGPSTPLSLASGWVGAADRMTQDEHSSQHGGTVPTEQQQTRTKAAEDEADLGAALDGWWSDGDQVEKRADEREQEEVSAIFVPEPHTLLPLLHLSLPCATSASMPCPVYRPLHQTPSPAVQPCFLNCCLRHCNCAFGHSCPALICERTYGCPKHAA